MHKKTEIHQMQTMLKCISDVKTYQTKNLVIHLYQRVRGRIVKIVDADDVTHLRCIVNDCCALSPFLTQDFRLALPLLS